MITRATTTRASFRARWSSAAPLTPLLLAGLLSVAGCASAASSGAAGGASLPGAAAGSAAAAGSGAGAAGSGGSSCSGGLKPTDPGVVDIFCDGTAKIHVTAGSLTKDFTGGQCHQASGVWSAAAGVVTQQGVYTGKPVDVVTVNNQTSPGVGTIQLTLSGHIFFDDSASFALASGGSGAHLSGTAQSLPSGPDTPVTVDVTC